MGKTHGVKSAANPKPKAVRRKGRRSWFVAVGIAAEELGFTGGAAVGFVLAGLGPPAATGA
jgi:hypothetical protein